MRSSLVIMLTSQHAFGRPVVNSFPLHVSAPTKLCPHDTVLSFCQYVSQRLPLFPFWRFKCQLQQCKSQGNTQRSSSWNRLTLFRLQSDNIHPKWNFQGPASTESPKLIQKHYWIYRWTLIQRSGRYLADAGLVRQPDQKCAQERFQQLKGSSQNREQSLALWLHFAAGPKEHGLQPRNSQ